MTQTVIRGFVEKICQNLKNFMPLREEKMVKVFTIRGQIAKNKSKDIRVLVIRDSPREKSVRIL